MVSEIGKAGPGASAWLAQATTEAGTALLIKETADQIDSEVTTLLECLIDALPKYHYTQKDYRINSKKIGSVIPPPKLPNIIARTFR